MFSKFPLRVKMNGILYKECEDFSTISRCECSVNNSRFYWESNKGVNKQIDLKTALIKPEHGPGFKIKGLIPTGWQLFRFVAESIIEKQIWLEKLQMAGALIGHACDHDWCFPINKKKHISQMGMVGRNIQFRFTPEKLYMAKIIKQFDNGAYPYQITYNDKTPDEYVHLDNIDMLIKFGHGHVVPFTFKLHDLGNHCLWRVVWTRGVPFRKKQSLDVAISGIIPYNTVIIGKLQNDWIKHLKGWSMISKYGKVFLRCEDIRTTTKPTTPTTPTTTTAAVTSNTK
jgi:hypothetical protein